MEKQTNSFNEDRTGITFVNRHEWVKFDDGDQLLCLNHYAIKMTLIGTSGIYHRLSNVSVPARRENAQIHYRLLKHTVDEETGKNIMLVMDLTEDEANAIEQQTKQLEWSNS